MRSQRPNLTDVAKRSNVSVSTASRVINCRSGVDQATRSAVWEAVRELKYEVVRNPDVLSGVLVVAPWVSFGNTYWQLIMSGILDEASKSSLPVTFCTAASPQKVQGEVRSLLSRDGILGVILACFPARIPLEEWLPKEPEAATVALLMGHEGNTVAIDMHRAVYQVTRHLLELGHTRVHLAINSTDWWSQMQRLQGFTDALGALGNSRKGRDHIHHVSLGRVSDWLSSLLAAPTPPTAIIGGTSELSKLIHERVCRLAIQVPAQLSFVGIGHARPWEERPFDTILQPSFDLGVAAVRALRRVVTRPNQTVRENLQAQVIRYGSVGAPPKSEF